MFADLAFIAYWGILLFGYDSGVAGGIVSQPYFQQEFGLHNADGTQNKERTNEVSSIVVSVLQAGAFFGALGSAPISSKLGRKMTLSFFTLVFSVGAILATAAHDHEHYGLELIYAGRAISGFGIGGISAVAPAFVSECAPKEVRGRITGIFQIMVSSTYTILMNDRLKEWDTGRSRGNALILHQLWDKPVRNRRA
ncbi:hypothetical protein C0989_004730 [Termitomyces sp. Mn162]|nr:hypothetical protein C0989_004730 [Termitomyces sp. Mn162]